MRIRPTNTSTTRTVRPIATTSAISAVLVTIALALTGCSGDDTGSSTQDGASSGSGQRSEVVADLVDTVVGPAHRGAADVAAKAKAAVHDACPAGGDVPSPAAVDTARAMASAGNQAWEALDPIDEGPIMDRRSRSVVGYPVNTAAVDMLLATNPPVDAETIAERTGSPRRGYGALIHLLSADPAAYPGPRCRYATAVVDAIAAELHAVSTAWFDASPPYVDRAAARADHAVPTQDTIDAWVNMSLSTLEADLKLLSDPSTAPRALDPAKQHLATIERLWGDADTGLGSLTSESVRDKLSSELQAATSAADAAALATAIQAIRSTLGTEVVSALDVTVGFSENDGDS